MTIALLILSYFPFFFPMYVIFLSCKMCSKTLHIVEVILFSDDIASLEVLLKALLLHL